MRSIRARLLAGTIITMALVIGSAGFVSFRMVRDNLLEQFDRSLDVKAVALASAIEIKDGHVNFDTEDLAMDEFEPDGTGYLEILRPDNTVLYRSPSLETRGLELNPALINPVITLNKSGSQSGSEGIVFPPSNGAATQVITRPNDLEKFVRPAEFDTVNGTAARRLDFSIVPTPDEDFVPTPDANSLLQPLSFAFVRETIEISSTLRKLSGLFCLLGFATILLSSALLWSVIRRSLNPLDAVATAIGGIGTSDLTARIAPRGVPLELGPVVDRLNELLARLRDAFERERAFSMDAAHELRTPLAGLRSSMEVALTQQRDAPQYKNTIEDCLDITVQMQTVVENLLTLARIDAGQFERHIENVALNDFVQAIVNPLLREHEAKHLHVEYEIGPSVSVAIDTALLTVIARNIVDNAFTYVNDGGSVRIESATEGAQIVLRIVNSGSAIAPEQIPSLFNRFWRGDSARSQTGLHCGLGLALVKRVAELLGGSVEITTVVGGEFAIAVSLPHGPS